ncbi:pseudaminic acid biosynthesis-associated protein PseG [Lysinibacillus fusiformis ZC1]|nr:UDP-2,4-diacetamido-2,4,6-trideoxy-beta-L-altropyranose hydrolase [uncultured Lysinibacillus sp.]EFI69160.1 pseudaminic acid biosynthesis-associated protein PseG [Lysinibacillus fusiformis ZC1]EKU40886.1 pseudaminic acid biosynthesis-associated protein PseG [Lysinibacillus fusiformis ZB2]
MIVFRVDGSVEIGAGHVMRCLTLAKELKQQGYDIRFISRKAVGDMAGLVESNGFIVYSLPYIEKNLWKYIEENWEEDACATIHAFENAHVELLIVDHYSIDEKWESTLRPYVEKIMVIDDLANRKHSCDILLDQNYYVDKQIRYVSLIPDYCLKLLGPKYAILRNEFIDYINLVKPIKDLKRLLLFMGGSDPTNETEKILQYILPIINEHKIIVDVVVGGINSNRERIKNICSENKYINYYCQIDNMAEMMVKADFCIGAGGATTWERCALGLPTATVIIAENQRKITEDVSAYGACIFMGDIKGITKEHVQLTILNAKYNISKLNEMSKLGCNLVDGKGTQRVIKEIQNVL